MAPKSRLSGATGPGLVLADLSPARRSVPQPRDNTPLSIPIAAITGVTLYARLHIPGGSPGHLVHLNFA